MDHMTAKVSCFARAYHYRHNTFHIFSDPAAEALLGDDYAAIARSMSQGVGFFMPGFQGSAEEGLRLIVDKQLSPSVLGRSAFCEAALQSEIRLGCRQVLILASGYDTYAVRSADAPLSIYELDLPEMLADKGARLLRAGLQSRSIHVPCDLSKPSWADGLPERGFERHEKAFASLLGISYYLDKAAFGDLLGALGALMCEGSSICLDYPTDEGGPEARTNRALASGAGEAMRAQYGIEEMERTLEARGFLVYEHLDRDGMTRRFFAPYNRRNPAHPMEAPRGVCYLHAVKKS